MFRYFFYFNNFNVILMDPTLELEDIENDGLNVEIRKLSSRNVFDLSQILELGDAWKELMAIVPKEDDSHVLKYNNEQMRMVQGAADKQKRTCSEIFLEEWGSSGCKRPDLILLLKLLKEAELYRAADYVAVNLLKVRLRDKGEHRQRFSEALILEDTTEYQPTAPPLSNNTSDLDENTFNLQQTVKISQDNIGCTQEICGVKMYKYNEFLEGTNRFSESLKLGEGGFGSVYLCTILGREKIAVKRLHTVGAIPGVSELQFRNELLTVTRFTHHNLLPLVGYSSNGPELCLAYKYMRNGSLQDCLKINNGRILNWEERFEIACGTAEGLVHLHTFAPKPLVHRDVKSANILLDHDLTPKVGDFGLAKHGANGKNTKTIAMTSTVVGTSAYMAPEAFRGDVSVKMDVFSFGVVLLELVTGLPPFDEEREGRDLASHVEEVEELEILIDQKPELDMMIANGIFQLAHKCLLEKKSRPNMVATLKSLQEIQKQ